MGLNAKVIGLKILQARLAKGMTQAELARALGVDRGTVGRWETGHAVPRQVSVPKVAQALGQAPEALLAGADVIDVAHQNQEVLRSEKATLKEIRDQVKRLTKAAGTPTAAPLLAVAPVVMASAPEAPVATASLVAIARDSGSSNPADSQDRVLAEIIKGWGSATPAARLVAALLITGDWSYRLKLLNQEIDVDEEVIRTLRRAF